MQLSKRRSNGGRPTAAQIVLRDERILKIAIDLFAENGFSATTLESIARHARVALRTIYQQFGGKEEIFAAAIRRYVDHIQELDLELDRSGSASEVLRDAASKLVQFCTSEEAVVRQRLMIAESTRFPDLMTSLLQEGHGKTLAVVERVLTDAIQRRLIVAEDVAVAARMFLEITVGWSLMFAAAGDRTIIPDAGELDVRVDVFLSAYGARRRPRKRSRGGLAGKLSR